MLTTLPTIHNHCVRESYADLSGIKGAVLYPGRVLACTKPGDIVQLPPELQDDLPVIREHYRRIGLRTATDVVWDLSYDVAQRYPEHGLSVFLYGPSAYRVRPNRRRQRAVARLNSKNWFIDQCKRLRLPIPLTDTYEQGETPEQRFAGPWFVKGDVAASGTQVFECATWDEVLHHAAASPQDYQVQQSAAVTGRVLAFLNVQYMAYGSGEIDFVEETEQELDAVAHDGNRFPARYSARCVADKVALMAADEGVEGIIAFDVIVVDTPEGLVYLLLECNPRPNGSSYFTIIAKRLRAKHWLGLNNVVTTKDLAGIVGALHNSGEEYNPVQQRGAVVVNWGTVSLNKVGMLYMGTPAQVLRSREVVGRLVA